MSAAPTPSPSEPATASSRALADLPLGACGSVDRVEAPPAIAARLADLGFLPGTPVTVRGRAPLGDPRIYELRGVRFCLRRSEAALIRVRVEDPAAGRAP